MTPTPNPGTKARGEDRDDELERLRNEAERYRRAAEDALQQLDWCIGYLHEPLLHPQGAPQQR